MRLLAVALLVGITGCFSPGPGVDATCAQLHDAFASAAPGLVTACNVDDDCIGIGGKGDNNTCDCAATLPAFAVTRSAYDDSDVKALADLFYAQCADDPSVAGDCDASPVLASCSHHVCVMSQPSCFGTDAGL